MSESIKVLLVDDEIEILENLAEFLADEHYEVRAASSVKDALKELKQNEFDFVISDIKMPDCSGFDLLEKIRDIAPASKVVFLSGFSEHTEEEIKKMGAVGLLFKPDDLLKLPKTLKILAAQYKK